MTSIFIQSIADYNAGRIIGKWVDVTDMTQDDLWEAINEVLAMSKEPNAEEYEIADYDGFYHLRPYADRVLEVAKALNEHGEAYALYTHHVGEMSATQERFDDAYCGQWSSFLDYATALFDELYLDTIPDSIRFYIDYEAFARDLEINDYFWEKSQDLKVHIFRHI